MGGGPVWEEAPIRTEVAFGKLCARVEFSVALANERQTPA